MPLQPGQTPAQIAAAHAADDFETLRVHPIRTLQNMDRLADDGIAALDNGDLGVVREFLERIQEHASKELEWLRGQRK